MTVILIAAGVGLGAWALTEAARLFVVAVDRWYAETLAAAPDEALTRYAAKPWHVRLFDRLAG